MKTYIGIDLGTSSAKFILCTADGKILNTVSEKYPIYYPRKGWSEQNPADWLEAVKRGVARLISSADRRSVSGIGVDGQMHGLVALDERDEVIRPCILWNDGRTAEQTDFLNNCVGKDKISSYTANIAYAGFTAPKLMWLKQHERDNFARISKIMLPKDYIVYMLTGVHSTDLSDASGTLLLDVKNKKWSADMCRIAGVDMGILPSLHESSSAVSLLKKEYLNLWGLKKVVVCAGASDNAAAAVCAGATGDGGCNISLGTSGVVFVSRRNFSPIADNALHNFCHADGGYHLLGCILSAASCYDWWNQIIQGQNAAVEQNISMETLGKNDVFFLPYLCGERSPHNDVNARGAFLGLSPAVTRKQMTLAVLEGVAFALRDCIEAARLSGVEINRSSICGGGSQSPLWRKIVANICNLEIAVPAKSEAAFGAAELAMVACGEFPDVATASKNLYETLETITLDKALTERYFEKYLQFKKYYPALKSTYLN